MDDELGQYLAGMNGEIIGKIVDTLTKRMRDVQSEILRGFEPFQKQTSAREAAMEARTGAAEQRLAVVQDRLG